MFPIVNKQMISKDVKRIDVKIPDIASKVKPGQFVMVVPEENSEWVPLSVIEADALRGTITLIFQERGEATRRLGALPINDSIYSVMGPLGQPATIKPAGTVVCVSTGVATASILPICRAFKKAENKVVCILAARDKKSLLLEAQVRLSCHRILTATEDGSYSRKGTAVDLFKEVLAKEDVQLVYTIGPVSLMREVARLTKERQIPSFVQVNTVMSCASGICGSCRLDLIKEKAMACVHGPEFDAHKVDFDKLETRLKAVEQARQAGRQDLAAQQSVLKKFFIGNVENE